MPRSLWRPSRNLFSTSLVCRRSSDALVSCMRIGGMLIKWHPGCCNAASVICVLVCNHGAVPGDTHSSSVRPRGLPGALPKSAGMWVQHVDTERVSHHDDDPYDVTKCLSSIFSSCFLFIYLCVNTCVPMPTNVHVHSPVEKPFRKMELLLKWPLVGKQRQNSARCRIITLTNCLSCITLISVQRPTSSVKL